MTTADGEESANEVGSNAVTSADSEGESNRRAWKISILLFGQLADHLDQRRIDVAVYEGTTAEELIERFGLTDWLDRGVSVAIDGEIGDAHRILHDGAEIALLPPVSGG